MPRQSEPGFFQSGDRRAPPRITVCVCTHDRPDYLRDCLDGMRNQTVGADEFRILVVDSGSSGAVAVELATIVAGVPNASLLRVDRPGLSLARNEAAREVASGYIAYIDDDAVPAPDWVAMIARAISATPREPAMIGGRILPLWEAPLPRWWPPSLRGVLSIIEAEGAGEYRRPETAQKLSPYGANMIVHVPSLLAAGGFPEAFGRTGKTLLSDEETVLAWRLQDAGHCIRYDSRIVVHHQIQAQRLTPQWLFSRMYWQGASRVMSHRAMGHSATIWRELPRRLAVAALFAPCRLIPRRHACLMEWRWRWAYAIGFLRAFVRR
jgi:glycosyltransferase involved in cell wall biosynthesis